MAGNSQTVFAPKSGAAVAKKLYTTYEYQKVNREIDDTARKTSTGLVSTYTNKFGAGTAAIRSQFHYLYDTWGNIIGIVDLDGNTRAYEYNDNNEVVYAREAYSDGRETEYSYSYDAGGNILTETVNGKVNTYSYDSVWKDKLVSYNGKTITYDEAGHPLDYMGSAMTWDASDRLTSISGKTANGTAEIISYTYLSDGSRRTKTVDGVTTTYHYNNGLLLSQSTGDEILHFYYDSTGKVVSIGYQKGTAAEVGYFFARNAQGDIIAVYRSSDSVLIGTYEYDLWGKPVSATEASAGIDTNGILSKNPFRYRGYYFDEETGFYYLNARYYDSAIRRFISTDSVIASVGTTVEGYNLFGYGFNNPVNMSDETGYWPRWITGAVAVGAVVVAGLSPALFVPASKVATVAAVAFVMQSAHYDLREKANENMPRDYDTAAKADGADLKVPAEFHQFSGNNRKVCLGHMEGIYDKDGNWVDDPRDVGTYNVCVPKGFLGTAGHILFDVIPWFVFGNNDSDPGPLINFPMKWIEDLMEGDEE